MTLLALYLYSAGIALFLMFMHSEMDHRTPRGERFFAAAISPFWPLLVPLALFRAWQERRKP